MENSSHESVNYELKPFCLGIIKEAIVREEIVKHNSVNNNILVQFFSRSGVGLQWGGGVDSISFLFKDFLIQTPTL